MSEFSAEFSREVTYNAQYHIKTASIVITANGVRRVAADKSRFSLCNAFSLLWALCDCILSPQRKIDSKT